MSVGTLTGRGGTPWQHRVHEYHREQLAAFGGLSDVPVDDVGSNATCGGLMKWWAVERVSARRCGRMAGSAGS